MQKRMDRIFSDLMPTIGFVAMRSQRTWRPPTDVYETEESVIVRVEIAGMSEQDFAVSLANRNLTISGTRRDPDYKLSFQQLEIPYGDFCTQVFLPYAVERQDIRATYENGFLTVVLPKIQARHIDVAERTASTDERKG